jgi:hypothetical protein
LPSGTSGAPGRIFIRLEKATKKIAAQTVLVTFQSGRVEHVSDWKKVEYNPVPRTKFICNDEVNTAATIIGSAVKNVYGFTDATLKTKKVPGKPLYWNPAEQWERNVADACLAAAGVEPRFVMELCSSDGETVLAPRGVAFVMTSPVTMGEAAAKEIMLPLLPPPANP